MSTILHRQKSWIEQSGFNYPMSPAHLGRAFETLFQNNDFYAAFYRLVISRAWAVMSAADGLTFLKGDNPVVLTGRKADRTWRLVYPLTPTRCFIAGPALEDEPGRIIPHQYHLTGAETAVVNAATCRFAETSVIGVNPPGRIDPRPTIKANLPKASTLETHDEYGMYMAKSSSLRSSDLSRQVGAAIFRSSGEVVTMGCNEVPKSGGGTYWSGDSVDKRDFVQGHDPNERKKIELLVDLLDRLKKGGHLSDTLMSIVDPYEISEKLLKENADHSVSESRMMDIIEFGRIIHAEMSAICDASRKGVPISDCTLYCTAFPCHLCAKHIVASGIKRVVYLEPYPKSYAVDLHGDSIEVDPSGPTGKVSFEAFIGISPYRYRDLFEKGKRKYSSGVAQKWHDGAMRPMIEVYYPSYFKGEAAAVGLLKENLEKLVAQHDTPSQE